MTEDYAAREALARIEERMAALGEDVKEMKACMQCFSHAERIKGLERIVYGMLTVVVGLVAKAVYGLFK